MKYFFPIFFFLICTNLNAQYGFSVSYDQLMINGTNNQTSDNQEVIPSSNVSVAANYWFRLKNKRIEFFPEVAYKKAFTSKIGPTSIDRSYIGINLNTSFYIFDLLGDCDCPTWSKDGEFLKKGFFVEISPGVFYNPNRIVGNLDLSTVQGIESPSVATGGIAKMSYKLGFGIGIDIGITDFATITPFVRYDIHFGDQWFLLSQIKDGGRTAIDETESNSHAFLRVGIRTGLRPDYKKRYRPKYK